MPSLKCNCGAVEYDLATAKPRIMAECCCNSCHARTAVLAARGGPSLPEDVMNRKAPTTFVYFPNGSTTLKKGDEKLLFYKLTEGTPTVNLTCKDCHTYLLGYNSNYTNTFWVAMGLDALNDVDFSDTAITLRVNTNFMPDMAEKGKAPHCWFQEDGTPTGTEGWEPKWGELMKAFTTPPTEAETPGKTVPEMLEDYTAKGGAVEVIVLEG